MGDGIKVTLWSIVGVALIIGLAWLGEVDPLRSTREITISAGDGQTEEAEALMVDMFAPGGYLGDALIPASVLHVATTTNDDVTTDIYTYNSVFEDRGAMRCTLSTRMSDWGGGAGGGCPPNAQSSTHVSGSVSSGSSLVGQARSDHQHTATVVWGHDDAEWAIVETTSGQRIKSNVIEGTAITTWNGPFEDQAETIILFDGDANVLWSQEQEPFPPLPDMSDVDHAVQAAVDDG